MSRHCWRAASRGPNAGPPRRADQLGLEIGQREPSGAGRSDRLDQVVRNLLLNAIRHSPPGGLIRVSAILPAPDTGVTISVEDTGSGIAPADLPRIWDRFYRADRERGRVARASGLPWSRS